LAVAIALCDEIDTTVWLSLPSYVGCIRSIVACRKQGASQQGAPILSVVVVVRVKKCARIDVVTHSSTIKDSVNKAECQVVRDWRLRGTGQVLEGGGISVNIGRWFRALETRPGKKIEDSTNEIVVKPWDDPLMSLRMFPQVPPGLAVGLPRSIRGTVVIVGSENCAKG